MTPAPLLRDPELAAIHALILREPEVDLHRGVFADVLERLTDTVACGRCHLLDNGVWCVRSPKHTTMMSRCPTCKGDGRVSNGAAERAECIRYCIANGCSHVFRPGQPAEIALLDSGGLARIAPALPRVAYTVRRGFVEGVTFERFADFWGGVCENCEGEGRVETGRREGEYGPCGECGGGFESRDEPGDLGYYRGTGRTPPLGPVLAAQHPVTDWRFNDKSPTIQDGQYLWWNGAVGGDTEEFTLPNEFFMLLNERDLSVDMAVYENESNAWADASQAAGVWARGRILAS